MIVPRHYEDLCVLHENLMPRRGYYIPASRPMVLCVSVSADAGVFAGDDGVWLGWI